MAAKVRPAQARIRTETVTKEIKPRDLAFRLPRLKSGLFMLFISVSVQIQAHIRKHPCVRRLGSQFVPAVPLVQAMAAAAGQTLEGSVRKLGSAFHVSGAGRSPHGQSHTRRFWGAISLTAPDSMGFLKGSTLYACVINTELFTPFWQTRKGFLFAVVVSNPAQILAQNR